MSEQGVVSHLAYDWMIVMYFFLGGLSVGAYLFSVAANYWKQEYKHLAKRSAVLSLIVLAIGMFMLLIHLGRPERFWRVFTSFNPHSMLSWGAWILNIFGLLVLIYTGLLFIAKENTAKKIAYIGLPFALLTAVYTAVHIARAPDKLLWHSTLMPILFVNGAIISGIALVILFSANAQNAELFSKLGKLLAWMVVVELCMVLLEVLMLLNGGTESIAVARSLVSGEIGFLFLGVEIVIGAVVPVAILLRAKPNALLQIVASILILIGIFTMRYVIVVGGQLIS
ncbi:MAG: DmsC/YnfH family molybdoenzyme membrane anchor subunit [Planctomycetota bacterium]|jgi:polysulfide reductase chain C